MSLSKVVDFLRHIGLAVVECPGANGFVKGVDIRDGVLYVDPDCHPSILLHEAGHIAIVPGQYRRLISGNWSVGIRQMFDDLGTMDIAPDSPLMRAALQCSDPEATAWAWAAGVAVGLAPSEIILSGQYERSGALVRAQLQANHYPGINGLAHAGMCVRGRLGDEFGRYPKMQVWIQPEL